jgi:ppGpp synthetase/RelA/SpoT-type nucleotidyltranferase
MSLEVTDTEIDQLIAPKLPHAFTTQLIANSVMTAFLSRQVIEPPPLYVPRQNKRRSRIYDKIKRYLEEKPNWDLETAVNHVDDLAGGRFVVHYIGDVCKFHEHICSEFEKRDDIKVIGNGRNCVFKPRASGFRALTQDIKIKIKPHFWFPFEMQFMTYLSHDWDQKQHYIYENQEDIPDHIQQVFLDLSETLFKVDQTFENLRPVLKSFTKK